MKLKTCRIFVTQGWRTTPRNVDLLLAADRPPAAVFEWLDSPDGDSSPALAVELEPEWLYEICGRHDVTHLYELPVHSPTAMTVA
ncbi:hypothetical protein V4F39_02045 [Aquincola sp. MAHUQ-54]|uniref:Uncharacterized protein n=1 Tax=Aquincola agrisoli TaxID=3119538 RepID=A0AAW9PY65_9BURK